MINSWGSNSHGQLGLGVQIEQLLVPTEISINIEAKYISGGGKHTLVLTTSNDMLSCGDNDKGQLGQNLSILLLNRFQPVCSPYKIIKISCGWDFNLALTDSLEVLGWGSNSFGQLGLPLEAVKSICSPTKIFHKKALEVGSGLRHSVIIDLEGLIYTSGYGRKGQLGITLNDNIPIKIDKFTQVKGIEKCDEISCGECHCLAKTASQELYSWGNNKYGQLGFDPNTTPMAAKPKKIIFSLDSPLNNKIYSGWAHNCILTGKGQVITWGRNDLGQLGEERKNTWIPEKVKNLKSIKQVSLGSHHTIALSKCGNVFSWGWNEHGNCGNNSTKNLKTPHKIKQIKKVKLIGSGAAHSFLCLEIERK